MKCAFADEPLPYTGDRTSCQRIMHAVAELMVCDEYKEPLIEAGLVPLIVRGLEWQGAGQVCRLQQSFSFSWLQYSSLLKELYTPNL